MSRQKATVVKSRSQKEVTKSFKEIANRLKVCNCGHQIVLHEMEYGCTAIVEGSECEDHWVCGCKDVVSIHINAYQKQRKAARR